MKLLLTLAFMLPLLSCSPLWNKSSGSNPRPDGPATSYEYSYNGTMMYPIKYYSVKRDADGAVCIAFLRNSEPEVRVIAGPEDFFARVDALVAEYGLHRLKESYRPRMEVLDGRRHQSVCGIAGRRFFRRGRHLPAGLPGVSRAGVVIINYAFI